MKIKTLKQKLQGNVLLIAMCFTVIIGAAMEAYWIGSQTQCNLAYRSEHWNGSLMVTESGMEDALAFVNKYQAQGGDISMWTNDYAAEGWTFIAPNIYTITRTYDSQGDKYMLWVTNHWSYQDIVCEGVSTMGVSNSVSYYSHPSGTMLAAAGSSLSGQSQQKRAVLVRTGGSNLTVNVISSTTTVNSSTNVNIVTTTNVSLTNVFLTWMSGGILVKKGVTLSGTETIDSISSTATNYLTKMNVATAQDDRACVGTVSSNQNIITDSGNAKVYGYEFTCPGGSVNINGNASIGSLSWVNGGNNGVQSGHWLNNLHTAIPDAPPSPSGASLTAWPNAVNKTTTLNGGGLGNTTYYRMGANNNSLSGQNTILVTNGNVVIVCDSGVGFSASGQGEIDLKNANLTWYLDGNLSISGQGIVNGGSYAMNCTIFGSPNCKSVSYSGNSAFIGTIDAPEADISLTGGGNTPINFIGGLIGNSLNVSGNYWFRYDEALSSSQYGNYYTTQMIYTDTYTTNNTIVTVTNLVTTTNSTPAVNRFVVQTWKEIPPPQ